MNTLKNPHPGEILLEDFMKPLELTAYRLAKETGMPQTRLSEIIHGRRSLTADTAVRLSAYFGNDPRFWLGLQNDFDLEEVKRKLSAGSLTC